MATWTNGATALSAANMNRLMQGDGVGEASIVSVRIYYNGSTWTVDSTLGQTDQAGNLTATWVGASNRLEVDITGLDRPFTTAPIPIATPYGQSSTWTQNVRAWNNSTTDIYVQFYDSTDPPDLQTTEATTMDFTLTLIGLIS